MHAVLNYIIPNSFISYRRAGRDFSVATESVIALPRISILSHSSMHCCPFSTVANPKPLLRPVSLSRTTLTSVGGCPMAVKALMMSSSVTPH